MGKGMSNISKYKWFEQRPDNGLHYNQVYELLDELSFEGFTPLQIQEIIRLGKLVYQEKNARK